MTIFVTGGAGFIGSNFILGWLGACDTPVINFDKLTYAGNVKNFAALKNDQRHIFVRGDIADQAHLTQLFSHYKPSAILHFAAESHVDRSIRSPEEFIQTNIVGTFRLLEAARAYWSELDGRDKSHFRFVHVSTDEVYGTLGAEDPAFTEQTKYSPNSPYSASKAASDHLARSYFHTYGMPVLTTNCSNNYGPYQFPEKLIPLIIHNALSGEALPVYGDGRQIRDWLYVRDHCAAVCRVLEAGEPGQVYNIGGRSERTNLDVVKELCRILDEQAPRPDGGSYYAQVRFVADRPGHDRRYSVDTSKIYSTLGWRPSETLESGLRKTVKWYLDNQAWVKSVTSGDYRRWVERQYG